ncbi:MAG: diadenylate cyclase CdaA [Lachnospiraceae bacterium]|nr:diadenylate cyclase CdaA [Lachnospiraceae bacterium]
MSQYLETIRVFIPSISAIRPQDYVEVIILSFLFYQILVWVKNTRAYSLLKGILLIVFFLAIASLLEMNTIVWMAQNLLPVALTAIVIILQPEIRKAVEELGRKKVFASIIPFDFKATGEIEGRFSDRTINEIVRASVEMGKVKTGALIVLEQEQSLNEYERTGIDVDAVVTSQLLINIFEKNTPLHDGAVIISGNRVVSATCYLPLTDSTMLSKELGTRHRAGIGISEATDSMTIIVSEETGNISVAYLGKLTRMRDGDHLKETLQTIQNKTEKDSPKTRRIIWKGLGRSEK